MGEQPQGRALIPGHGVPRPYGGRDQGDPGVATLGLQFLLRGKNHRPAHAVAQNEKRCPLIFLLQQPYHGAQVASQFRSPMPVPSPLRSAKPSLVIGYQRDISCRQILAERKKRAAVVIKAVQGQNDRPRRPWPAIDDQYRQGETIRHQGGIGGQFRDGLDGFPLKDIGPGTACERKKRKQGEQYPGW